MKLFISTDMEGVIGVSSWNEMNLSVNGHNVNSAINNELNWIVDGIKSSDIDDKVDEITICDSHSRGENVPYGQIEDKRVNLIRGYPRKFYMMQGLDESYDAVMLIGYHARIGSFKGLMDHSYSSSCIYNIRINDILVGEVEINAFLAGFYDVPVCMISGDDVLEEQMREFYGNDFPYVRTKEGIGRFAGKMYHPDRVRDIYASKVKEFTEIVNGDGKKYIKKATGNTKLEIELVNTVITDAVSAVPGLERIDGRTVRYYNEDFREIYKMIITIAMLGGKFSNYI